MTISYKLNIQIIYKYVICFFQKRILSLRIFLVFIYCSLPAINSYFNISQAPNIKLQFYYSPSSLSCCSISEA